MSSSLNQIIILFIHLNIFMTYIYFSLAFFRQQTHDYSVSIA